MLFKVIDGSTTRISVNSLNPKSSWLIHNVEGWYSNTTEMETEPYAFANGEALIRANEMGREIKIDLSYYNANNIVSAMKTIDAMNGKAHTISIEYTAQDRGRTGTETISGAYVVSTSVDTISKNEFTVTIEFRTLNQNKTYS